MKLLALINHSFSVFILSQLWHLFFVNCILFLLQYFFLAENGIWSPFLIRYRLIQLDYFWWNYFWITSVCLTVPWDWFVCWDSWLLYYWPARRMHDVATFLDVILFSTTTFLLLSNSASSNFFFGALFLFVFVGLFYLSTRFLSLFFLESSFIL